MSYPSIFPYTPLSGNPLLPANSSASDIMPKSPACHISSQPLKYLNTCSSRYPCVSDISPIRVTAAICILVFELPNMAYIVLMLLTVAQVLAGSLIIYYAILSFIPAMDKEARVGLAGLLSIVTVIVYMSTVWHYTLTYYFLPFGALVGIAYGIVQVRWQYASMPPWTTGQPYRPPLAERMFWRCMLYGLVGICQTFLFIKLLRWLFLQIFDGEVKHFLRDVL